MKWACPHCQKLLNVKETSVGKRVRCSSCGKTDVVRPRADSVDALSEDRWFHDRDPLTERVGPFSEHELRQRAREGLLMASDSVWRDRGSVRQRADHIDFLKPILEVDLDAPEYEGDRRTFRELLPRGLQICALLMLFVLIVIDGMCVVAAVVQRDIGFVYLAVATSVFLGFLFGSPILFTYRTERKKHFESVRKRLTLLQRAEYQGRQRQVELAKEKQELDRLLAAPSVRALSRGADQENENEYQLVHEAASADSREAGPGLLVICRGCSRRFALGRNASVATTEGVMRRLNQGAGWNIGRAPMNDPDRVALDQDEQSWTGSKEPTRRPDHPSAFDLDLVLRARAAGQPRRWQCDHCKTVQDYQ